MNKRSNPAAGLVSICLVAAMLIFMLSSCGIIIINRPDDRTETYETTAKTQTGGSTGTTGAQHGGESKRETAQRYLDKLPEYYMSNTSVIISSFDGGTLMPEGEENNLSKAKYERYKMLNKKYGVNVIVTTANNVETIYTELKDSVNSGMYYADLLLLPSGETGRFYAAGYLLNIMSLPYVSLDEPYFDKQSVLQSTAGYRVYAAAGEATKNPDYINGVFFNTTIAQCLNMGDPYEIVRKGDWTWDVYRAMAKAAAYDINGAATGKSGHGAQSGDRTYSDMVFGSSGLKYVDTGWGRQPAVNEPGDRQAKIADIIYSLLYGDKTYFKGDKSLDTFAAGDMLFYMGKLSTIYDISSSTARWGILPLPKTDVEQSAYSSAVSSEMPVFAVPSNNSKLSETGIVLQSLNAASYGYLTDEYITYSMNHTVRDNGTLNMIDIIANTTSWDFALVFGSGYTSLGKATYDALYSSINSKYSYRTFYNNNIKAATNELSTAFPIK